jgi:hypothetical protein
MHAGQWRSIHDSKSRELLLLSVVVDGKVLWLEPSNYTPFFIENHDPYFYLDAFDAEQARPVGVSAETNLVGGNVLTE